MFLKKDNDKQRLYFKDLYGICMMIQGCHYEPGAGGRGFPPATMSVALRLLLMENRRKLQPRDESQERCLIPRLLVVFTRQLEILTTTL